MVYLFLAQGLFYHETEEYCISKLPQIVEQVGPGLWEGHNVYHIVEHMTEDPKRRMGIGRKLALWFQRPNQCSRQLKEVPLYEGFHHAQQFIQHHRDALVPKKLGNALEMNWSNEVFVLVVDETVGLVQSFVSPQEVWSLGFSPVPLHGLRECDVVAFDEPVGRPVVAVGRQEVVVELPEHMEGDSSVRSLDAVVCLAEHLVKLVECEMFGKELVGQPVHFDQTLQLHNPCGDE